MAVRKILHLGNPDLYEVSQPVEKAEIGTLRSVISDLHDTLLNFRSKYGVGRAIAAPQIGVMKRIIYMYIDKPEVYINPELKNLSDEKFEIWDDCMSFPELLVRVERHKRCTIDYL
ncbi:MAG: peptide deformylase, partial [Candidatus Thorarchaeota archaeon]|nr:peptide deformylase [Candidatus Thorarchaeota archaeon]